MNVICAPCAVVGLCSEFGDGVMQLMNMGGSICLPPRWLLCTILLFVNLNWLVRDCKDDLE